MNIFNQKIVKYKTINNEIFNRLNKIKRINNRYFKVNMNLYTNLIEKIIIWFNERFDEDDLYKIIKKDCKYNISDWDDKINFLDFCDTLTDKEKMLIKPFEYDSKYYLNDNETCIITNSEGIITESKCLYFYTSGIINDDEIIGLHISEFNELLRNNWFFDRKLDDKVKRARMHNEIYNNIMYVTLFNIISNYDSTLGVRRGLLFCREFSLDVNIPIIYGLSKYDYKFEDLIKFYLNNGGSIDTNCYVDFFGDYNIKKEILNVLEFYKYMKEITNSKNDDTYHVKVKI